MASLRKEFLYSIQSEDDAPFLTYSEQHKNKHDPFDLNEIVTVLSYEQLDELWTALLNKCTANILAINAEADEKLLEHTSDVLDAVITVALVTISQEDAYIPQQLFEASVILHGILLTLPESLDKLQNSISRLCERWYTAELDGRNELVSQTVTYLITRSLRPKALVADIKRVWALRHSLLLIDFANQSSEELKALLLQCVIHMPFVKCEKGRRFLSFLFGLNPGFIELLHKAIKTEIPYSSKSVLGWYSEVYFCAWRAASGVYLDRIENDCLQDLMFCAVHAPRSSCKSLAFALRKVLCCFHKEKKQKGVDEMLLRLYDPILWRSLKVANRNVRANAATLLIEAFPLMNPDGSVEEIDNLMQKQFDILLTLLDDPCPSVRVVAIQGVCRICNVFWEMIPTQTIRTLIGKLVNDLAWDASSAECRSAVCRGLASLLDNHLSHPLLKALLPELRNLFHDSSERVRVSFTDLLLKVKGLRAIKFWSVVPIEHLLARLEIDSPPVSRRIVNLVFNSFMPTDKDSGTQVTRCVTLLETNARAARKFYQYARGYMSVEEIAKLMLLLCRCLRGCLTNEGQRSDQETSQLDETEKENDTTRELSLNDTEIMTGFLETIAILWAGIEAELRKPGYAEVEKRLHVKFGRSLNDFFTTFTDPRAQDALIFIAGFLPSGSTSSVSQTCLSKLKSLPVDCAVEDFGTVIESLCRWGKHRDIIDLISDWLMAGLNLEQESGQKSKPKNARRRRQVKFTEPTPPKPSLALRYLSHLVKDNVRHSYLLGKAKDQLREIVDQLKMVKVLIEKRLTSDGPLSELVTDDFLVAAFETYCKMEVVLYSAVDKDKSTIAAFEHLLTWADMELVFLLSRDDRTDVQKRTAADVEAPALVALTTKIVKTLLTISSNMLLIGVGDQEFASQLAGFTSTLLDKDHGGQLLPLVTEVLYQISELTLVNKTEADEGVGSHDDLVPGMLGNVIRRLATLIQKDFTQVDKVLASVKPAISGVLQMYYQRHCVDMCEDRHGIMGTIMSATLAEMSNAVHQQTKAEEYTNVSALPKLTSCLLSIIIKKNTLLSSFTNELNECVTSGVLEGTSSYLAVLHIINTISKVKPTAHGLKDCILSVQTHIESITDTESKDASEILRYESSKKLINACSQTLGMVI